MDSKMKASSSLLSCACCVGEQYLFQHDLVVEVLVRLVVLADRQQQVVLDVAQRRAQEGVPRVLDAVGDPGLEVQELALAREDGERDCEVVVVPVGQRDEALLDHLRDVEHAAEVQRVLLLALALVELADAGDDQVLVGLPQALQQPDVVGVVVQVGREDLREDLVQHRLPARRTHLRQRLDQQLGVLAHRHFKQLADLEVVVVGDLDEELDEVEVAPELLGEAVAVLDRLLDLAVGQFEEPQHLRLLAAVDLHQEVRLRLRVVPPLEEHLLGQLELVIGLLPHALQRPHERQEALLRTELQLGPVDLQVDVLPLEVGHGLHAVGDKVVDVPPRRRPLPRSSHLCPVYAFQLLAFQVLLARHQQVRYELLHARVHAAALLRHHQQAFQRLLLADRAQLAQH